MGPTDGVSWRKRCGLWHLIVLVVVIVATTAVAGCATRDPSIDYDASVDFSQYKTWAWVDPDLIKTVEPGGDPRSNPLVVQRVREAVETNLERKGLRKAESGTDPGLLVAPSTGVFDRQVVRDWGPSPATWRYGWRYGTMWYDPFDFPRTTVSTFLVRTIAVDMFDGATRRPIWHGHAAKFADAEPEMFEIDEVVGAILARFPPQPGTAPVASAPTAQVGPVDASPEGLNVPGR